MPDHCTPKLALFGWLPQRPPRGPLKRWRDQIRHDLKMVGVPEAEWYSEATSTSSREGWHAIYHLAVEETVNQQQQQQESTNQAGQVECHVCGQSFRQESDKKRHTCIAEWSKPVWDQHGAVQCGVCQWWFRSRGGLTIHRCREQS